MMPRSQSSRPSKCSETITTISPAIPMPTATAQSQPTVSQCPEDPSVVFRELSSAEMELFKANMQLSKEEESEGQLEGRLARCWTITAIALLGQRLALVCVELRLNMIRELCIASFTDSQNGHAIFSLDDPHLAFLHGFSLAHLTGRA